MWNNVPILPLKFPNQTTRIKSQKFPSANNNWWKMTRRWARTLVRISEEKQVPPESTSPDLSFEVSHLQQSLTQATYATAKQANTQVKRPQPQPPHRRGTFHRRLQPLYTEKHKVSCSGFLPNSPLPFLTTSHRHHFPSSPLPFVTTSLRHHFPSSALPFIITSLPLHFPSSPLPFLTTSLRHHSPSSSLPFFTASLRHHSPSSSLPQGQFHSFLFFCYVLVHYVLLYYVLLHDLPPFLKVNFIASYWFVMYWYIMYCYRIYHPSS